MNWRRLVELIVTASALSLALALTYATAGAQERSAAGEGGAVRTLEAITIEGEVDVPQVLFITSRDHQRFRDDTGRDYRPDPLAVIRAATMPTRLRVVPAAAPAAPYPVTHPVPQD